jgi:hypothetical protein
MTGHWLAYCSACPVPEIANVLKRAGFCGCDNAAIHARTNLICSLAPCCRARRLRQIAATRTDSVLF